MTKRCKFNQNVGIVPTIVCVCENHFKICVLVLYGGHLTDWTTIQCVWDWFCLEYAVVVHVISSLTKAIVLSLELLQQI